jgi:hypothetical protein
MRRLANLRMRGPDRDSPGPSLTSARAAAPSPKRLLTTAVRMVPSSAYAAEQASVHSTTPSSPGWAADQPATTFSAFKPALHPMPTMSERLQCGSMPSSRISSALRPGVRKPVDVTQQR